MRLWVRTELLCIHFDVWKVALDIWPIPFVKFKAILVDKVLEHIRESRCIFVQEDLHNVRNDPKEIAHVLDKNCRFFVQRGASKAEEIKDLDVLDYDDDVYVSLCDWSGYDTTEVTSEESEDENTGALEQSLIEGEEIILFLVRKFFHTHRMKIATIIIMFYLPNGTILRVHEKSSQNKEGCDWLSVDFPLLKMRQSKNQMHSNISACVVTCLFSRGKEGTLWLLQVQTGAFLRVLHLILAQILTNVWKVWSETIMQLMVHMISFLIGLKHKKT